MEPLTAEMIANIYMNVVERGYSLTVDQNKFFLIGLHSKWVGYRRGEELVWSYYE